MHKAQEVSASLHPARTAFEHFVPSKLMTQGSMRLFFGRNRVVSEKDQARVFFRRFPSDATWTELVLLFHWLVAIGNCPEISTMFSRKQRLKFTTKIDIFFTHVFATREKESERLNYQDKDNFQFPNHCTSPWNHEKLQNKQVKLAMTQTVLKKRWFSNLYESREASQTEISKTPSSETAVSPITAGIQSNVFAEFSKIVSKVLIIQSTDASNALE